MTDRNSVTPTIANDNSSVAQISAGYMRAAGGVQNFQVSPKSHCEIADSRDIWPVYLLSI